jgi:hypothetical protein
VAAEGVEEEAVGAVATVPELTCNSRSAPLRVRRRRWLCSR